MKTQSEKQKLYQKIFNKLDIDNSGYLDIKEVSQGLHHLGFPLKNNQKVSKRLFDEIDKTQDEKIDIQEFCEFLDKRSQQFEEAYSTITSTSNITSFHIRKVLKKIDVEASDEQIRKFLNQIDHNKDGKVTYDDFYVFFALMPYPINAEAIFEKFSKFQFHDDSQGEYTQPLELEEQEDTFTKFKEISSKLVAGAIAGCISRTVTAPIDRLKIILQTNLGEQLKLIKVIKQIQAEDGFKGFFKGNGVNCIKIAPETSIKFVMFEQIKKIITQDPQNITVKERFISGGIAGGIAQIVIYPLEITKTRMALAKQGQYQGILDCMKQIMGQKGGVKQLYSGLTPSLIGIFPYAGIDLSINSLLKEMASSYLEKKQEVPGVGVLLTCGMISSSIGMLCTAPINIVRTRLQSNGLTPIEKQYKGTYDCFRRILKHEGITGFYKGMLPAMMKVLPATSISYTVYGLINQYLNQSDI